MIVNCDFCKSHQLCKELLPDGTVNKKWITLDEYRVIQEEQRKIDAEKRRIQELADAKKYHEDYEANIKRYNRSVKYLKKGNAIRRGDKMIDVKMFLDLPRDVQEKALGRASDRSPFAIEVLSQVPLEYWTDYKPERSNDN